MDREIIAVIVAKNGLDTAELLLEQKARTLENQAEDTTDGKQRTALQKRAKKTRKLVAVLNAAETGLNVYLDESSKL